MVSGDVRFKSGSGNMAFLCMRNASDNNYTNSSVIVDLAIGQILRSIERNSSNFYNCTGLLVHLFPAPSVPFPFLPSLCPSSIPKFS